MNDDATLPCAFIKHQLPGRVRLKIPRKRGDFHYFDRIAEAFTDCVGITQLQLNPPAASLLICHDNETAFTAISEFAATKSLFQLTEMPEDYQPFMLPKLPIATLGSAGFGKFDGVLLNYSQGRLDARSFLFLGLLGLALHQATRGNVMAPAASLFWYALELLMQEYEKRPESSPYPD